ncbi:MAG: hypothetical protein WA731_02210 [Pseudonocardiaceae bacterium]
MTYPSIHQPGGIMRLRKLAKDSGSDIGGCQTVYDVVDAGADPECVVQGLIISNSHLEDVLPGEGAVWIKREVLVEAVCRLQDEGAVARDG